MSHIETHNSGYNIDKGLEKFKAPIDFTAELEDGFARTDAQNYISPSRVRSSNTVLTHSLPPEHRGLNPLSIIEGVTAILTPIAIGTAYIAMHENSLSDRDINLALFIGSFSAIVHLHAQALKRRQRIK